MNFVSGIDAEPDEPPEEEEEEEEEEECKNQPHCDASFPNPPPKTRVKYECTTEEGCRQVPIKGSDDRLFGKAGKGSKGLKRNKARKGSKGLKRSKSDKPSDKDDYGDRGGGKCIHASEHPGWNADGWDEVQQYSDDLSNLRKFIVKLIDDSNRELIPKLLRLGFHDCVGQICDGCVDLNDMDNNGLRAAMDGLLPAVKEFKNKFSRGK